MSNLLRSVKAAGLNINSGSHDLMYVKYDALIVTHQHSILIIIIIIEICIPVELKCLQLIVSTLQVSFSVAGAAELIGGFPKPGSDDGV